MCRSQFAITVLAYNRVRLLDDRINDWIKLSPMGIVAIKLWVDFSLLVPEFVGLSRPDKQTFFQFAVRFRHFAR